MIILRLNENNFHDFQYSNYNSSTLLHDKIVKKRKNKTSLAKLLSSDERERNSFEGSINASVSFFLSRRIVETWNNLITKKGKNGETRVNHNACLILSSLPFLPFLEKWLFRTTVSDNGADNGLTSINQVQPGVIGRECKKKIEGVWECKSGWGTLLRGKERANSSWPIRETTSKRLFKIKKRKKKKEVYSVVITI